MLESSPELRQIYLDFFKQRGHVHVPSSPLIPVGDPTLLFTTAGMVQFKPLYTAEGPLPYVRATSVQKCLRMTDLEQVGHTPRHDTFFEMLGNFSFGDYFKEEAAAWAWEFSTQVLGLPRDKLFVSVFNGEGGLPVDEEAKAIWRKLGVADSHMIELGRADNFWGPAGGAGACGPSSEIYFDLGPETPGCCGRPECAPGCDCPRYMEFWNLVFPQYDADPDGTLKPLRNRGIDTGMGLERLAVLVQGKASIFETDLFAPIVERTAELAGLPPGKFGEHQQSLYVIADHVRALCFAMADGATPGNEGRGYVLRRMLRRASRRGRNLGMKDPFLGLAVDVVVQHFGGFYPELLAARDRTVATLTREEESFGLTYEQGMARLDRMMKETGSKQLSGPAVFELHDTYGFSLELTQEIAAERGFVVDAAGFELAMGEQRGRSRDSSSFEAQHAAGASPWHEVSGGGHSQFLGYDHMAAQGLKLRRWREVPDCADELEVVLDATPFYAASGGQVADTGELRSAAGGLAWVEDVYKEGTLVVHRVRVQCREEWISKGTDAGLEAVVDPRRDRIRRNHTATHLLHAALRSVLGKHVHQAGSLVSPERLRFDFTHFEPMQPSQVEEVLGMMNQWVLADLPVVTEVKGLEQARSEGAMALFGEKYGSEVRMVRVKGPKDSPDISMELCGGTHVGRTGEIGPCMLVAETGVASGTRRIEILTGEGALELMHSQARLLSELAHTLNTRVDQLPARLEGVKEELEAMKRREQQRMKQQALAGSGGGGAESSEGEAGGRQWRVLRIEADSVNLLREVGDRTREGIRSGVALVAAEVGGKLSMVTVVTDDLVAKGVRADVLVKEIAAVAGGSGGGKPTQALAGVKDPAQWPAIERKAREVFESALTPLA